jgi:3-oxoadipate enol-lactonase
VSVRELDVDLPAGRVHVEERGDAGAPLAICVHGLSGNLRSFDFLAERLVAARRRVACVDLRGRGRSEVTPPGSYGIEAHARDVLALASALGAERYDHVGWSLGALVGIVAAARAPERVRTLGLLDHAGAMDPAAVDAVRAALARLDVVVPDPEAYVAAIRDAGVVQPWSEVWEGVYRYELGRADGGWSPTTDRDACLEDLAEIVEIDAIPLLWRSLSTPAALVRCTLPINGGLIVPAYVRDAIRAAVPGLRLVELEHNHYGLMTDERTAGALLDLLEAAR